MEMGTVGKAMEREHREIDAGIEEFVSAESSPERREESLRRAIGALRRHIYLEEKFLFPPMRKDLAIPTMVMLREHGEIWRSLDAIEAELDEDGSEGTLEKACAGLLVQTDRHNEKEEPIFYSVADETLDQSQAEEFTELLETGELPSGWVCEKAGEELPPVPGQPG